MADTREEILVRLEELLGELSLSVYRNRGILPTDQRPAAVLLDGSGEVITSRLGRKGREVAMAYPMLVALRPQIFVVIQVRPVSEAAAIGPLLSNYLGVILKTVLEDPDLLQLVGSNGDIGLLRYETDMQTGSTMEGQLQVDFEFRYVLDVTKL